MGFAVKSMTDITAEESTLMEEGPQSSSAPANISRSGHGKEMPCSSGESLLMTADNKELIAPSSEMKAPTDHRTLSDRLTPSLISAGLVKGIIPMSMRKKSSQQTLDIVLRPQDGTPVESQKED
jgi:hypothetical protein